MTTERLLIVSPVHNEAEHLDRTAAAVAAQTRPPDRWLLVDDGSTDDTLTIARRWEAELDFLEVVEAPQPRDGEIRDRLALAKEARAFNYGLGGEPWGDFTHIGKLDGDVELPPDWFATLLERSRQHPRLGVLGGRLEEPDAGGWSLIPIPETHVHGAVKLYRRECLEAIGGMQERLAWDTIDETYARMRGYDVLSLGELVARHHRHWGSADGQLRGRARHGECAWIVHQSPAWAGLRALKLTRVPPYGLSGAAFFYGYVRCALRGTPRVDDPEFRSFMQRDLRRRMRAPVQAIGVGSRP